MGTDAHPPGDCPTCGAVGKCPQCKGAGMVDWLRPDAEPFLVVRPCDGIRGPCPCCNEGAASVWMLAYRKVRNAGLCPTHGTKLALARANDESVTASCDTCAAEGHPWVFTARKGRVPFKAFVALMVDAAREPAS